MHWVALYGQDIHGAEVRSFQSAGVLSERVVLRETQRVSGFKQVNHVLVVPREYFFCRVGKSFHQSIRDARATRLMDMDKHEI